MPFGRLHIITDTSLQNRYTHAELAARAIAGGASVIQYRSRRLSMRTMMLEAEEVCEVCRVSRVTFIVNDHVDVALAVGSDGVHLGWDDMPVATARRLMGDSAIIGGTARGVEDAVALERAGASYVGLGPIFDTASKRFDHEPIGVDRIRSVAPALSIPVIAIGGISVLNIKQIVDAGAWGAAIIGAVAHADDPTSATADLLTAMSL